MVQEDTNRAKTLPQIILNPEIWILIRFMPSKKTRWQRELTFISCL